MTNETSELLEIVKNFKEYNLSSHVTYQLDCNSFINYIKSNRKDVVFEKFVIDQYIRNMYSMFFKNTNIPDEEINTFFSFNKDIINNAVVNDTSDFHLRQFMTAACSPNMSMAQMFTQILLDDCLRCDRIFVLKPSKQNCDDILLCFTIGFGAYMRLSVILNTESPATMIIIPGTVRSSSFISPTVKSAFALTCLAKYIADTDLSSGHIDMIDLTKFFKNKITQLHEITDESGDHFVDASLNADIATINFYFIREIRYALLRSNCDIIDKNDSTIKVIAMFLITLNHVCFVDNTYSSNRITGDVIFNDCYPKIDEFKVEANKLETDS